METTILHGPTPEAVVRLRFVRHARLTDWNLPHMAAPFWRCYCALEAGGLLRLGGQEHGLRAGEVTLIPPRTNCASVTTRPFRKVYGHFSCLVARLAVQPGLYVTRLPAAEKEALDALARTGAPPADADPDLNLTFLMLRIIGLGLAGLPPEAVKSSGPYHPHVEQAIRLMHAHLRDPLDNAALAGALGLHPNSFVRLFTRHTGTAPQRYARGLRLEEACRLLVETTWSVERIADACGFWDRNHFTRAFTRHWQCPPATWRKTNR